MTDIKYYLFCVETVNQDGKIRKTYFIFLQITYIYLNPITCT